MRRPVDNPSVTQSSLIQTWKRIVQLSGGKWNIVVGIVFLLVIQSSLSPFTPLIISQIIDHGFSGTGPYSFTMLLLGLFSVAVLQSSIHALQNVMITSFSSRMVMNLRQKLFHTLQDQSIRFFTEEKSGDIISRLTSETNSVGETVLKPILYTIQAGLSVIVTLSTMFVLNWKLSLIILAVTPLLFIPIPILGRITYLVSKQLLEKNSQNHSLIAENLTISGVILSKLFGSRNFIYQQFVSLTDMIRKLTVKQAVLGSIFTFIFALATSMAPILVYWFGRPGSSFEVTAGIAVAFASYIGTLFNPIQQIGQLGVMIKGAQAVFERILGYIDLEPDILPAQNAFALDKVTGKIEFKNVSFSYDDQNQVLDEVNLSIQPGEKVYIVGKSGAGKTTIAYLLTRLIDPQSGEILMDGVNLKQITPESIHRFIGMLSQEVYLLHSTIRENLMLANQDATEEQMIEAAKLAHIHDKIISLENGYDTIVGERGYKLSGGEKQRISIARMFLKDPQILILDEATSSLDAHSERLIQESLIRLMRNRTVIVIAHRFSGIQKGDEVLVLEEGKIVQKGKHIELIREEGIYSHLYHQFYEHSDVVESTMQKIEQ